MTTTAPPRRPPTPRGRERMDPRMSARRKAVARQAGRRRLLWVAVVLAVVTVGVLVWFVLHTVLFGARAVTVTGNVHETPAQVVAAAGLASHPPLLDVDPAAVAARVERMPWVRAASVRVSWPDGVHIAIHEEAPHLAVQGAGGTWLSVSDDGRVLAATPSQPPGLLVLQVPVTPGGPGTVLPARDAAGLRVAATLPPSFAGQVTTVTVEPAGWVQLALTTPLHVDIGTATELTAKYEDVSAALAGATLHAGDVIDVSVPRAMTISPG